MVRVIWEFCVVTLESRGPWVPTGPLWKHHRDAIHVEPSPTHTHTHTHPHTHLRGSTASGESTVATKSTASADALPLPPSYGKPAGFGHSNHLLAALTVQLSCGLNGTNSTFAITHPPPTHTCEAALHLARALLPPNQQHRQLPCLCLQVLASPPASATPTISWLR